MWDTRIAKFRVSADSFVRQQEAHAKVRTTGAGAQGPTPELAFRKPLLTGSLSSRFNLS